MAQCDVMTDLVQFCHRQFEARRVNAPSIAEVHESSSFVEREDIPDAIAYPLRHVPCVMRKGFGSLARLPAADPVLKRLRQIPVIERRVGLDALDQELIDEAVVEIEPLGIRRAGSVRK